MTITICESSSDGHRLGYITYFSRQARDLGHDAQVEPSLARAMLARGALVIPMLEQRTFANLLALTLRALMGRRSLCLVFRAADAARSSSIRHRFKRALLRGARRLPRAGLISIVPVPAEPAIASLVNGWIYDPELCDLDPATLARTPAPDIAVLRDGAGARRIVVALGRQSADKGFGEFCDLWLRHAEVRERFLFVAGGTVPQDLAEKAARFAQAGGVLLDRRIEDDTLFDLYAVSDAVWCCYAPAYDQASGIFGRAVQFGRPTLVRRGSHVERFAETIAHPVSAIAWRDLDAAAASLLALPPASGDLVPGARNAEMAAHNRRVFAKWLVGGGASRYEEG